MPDQREDNIQKNPNFAALGLDMDSSTSQVKKGSLTYALNATVENYNGGDQINYQNETGNSFCVEFPEGYKVVGRKTIVELDKIIYFIKTPKGSEIGFSEIGKCKYIPIIKGACLNFNINYPIHKVEYEINGEAIRIYWADNYNDDRYLDLNNLPYKKLIGETDCDNSLSTEIDCNLLKVWANFKIPYISDIKVSDGGQLITGTYQFGIQYSDSLGTGYTGVYNITNPIPISVKETSQDFNIPTNKSIEVSINNLDTDKYEYFNLIVVETINNISTPKLAGIYPTTINKRDITYTGNATDINLSMDDVFQEFPIYTKSKGVTQSDKVLIWNGVTESKRVNYQSIASKIKPRWVSYKIPATKSYKDPEIATSYRQYMGGEVYGFEFQPILRSGKKCDGFHIPGRLANDHDREIIENPLVGTDLCNDEPGVIERWRIKDTSSVIQQYIDDEEDINDGEHWTYENEIKITKQKIEIISAEIDTLYEKEQKEINRLIDEIVYVKSNHLPNSSKGAVGFIIYQWCKDNGYTTDYFIEKLNETPLDRDFYPEGFLKADDILGRLDEAKQTRVAAESSLADFYNQLNDLFIEFNKSKEKTNICDPHVYQEGEFGYYESTETYPCNEEIWGDLAGKPIRHHKFPTRKLHDDEGNIYPLGVRFDVDQIRDIIKNDTTLTQEEKDDIVGFKILRTNRVNNKSVIAKGLINNVGIYNKDEETRFYLNYPYNDVGKDPFLSIAQTRDDSGKNPGLALNGFTTRESKKRFTFHSPDTSFYQPNLGSYIDIESIEYGTSTGHFVPVKEHPKYAIPSRAAYATAVMITMGLIAAGSKEGVGLFGIDLLGGAETNWEQALAVLQESIEIIEKAIPHKELAYQYNSVADYSFSKEIKDDVQTIYPLIESSRYISDGLASVDDIYKLNNYLRETSVYLRTDKPIPFTHEQYSEVKDNSRWIASENHCKDNVEKKTTVSSYYVAIKRRLDAQYGQIYSYETVDTGYYIPLDSDISIQDVFGGDTFINKFALKRKHSFFTQNLVGRQDDLALDFRDFGNVAYPTYWLSNQTDGKFSWGDLLQGASSILVGAAAGGLGSMSIGGALRGAAAGGILGALGVLSDNWRNNFDCKGKKFFYQDGKFYLFSYGIPYFYTESEVNVDYRQAFNNSEGDFYPNMGTAIPDEWLQEINTPIVNDNSYFYNKTYSKQNKESYFHHLPNNFDPDRVPTFINRAVYSEKQSSETNYKINRWLLYRPLSYYDFPQTNGPLTSLDRIKDGAILARFENKSELYNAMLRIDTSNPQAAYIGNTTLFSSAPPIDYSYTDTGYMGSQHTFFLRTPYGDITTDAKRGKIFLIEGQKAKEIVPGISKFLDNHLPFQLNKYFPDYNIDNNYGGVGLHGTYDDSNKRVIITKLDYKPIKDSLLYRDGKFLDSDLTDQIEKYNEMGYNEVEKVDDGVIVTKTETVDKFVLPVNTDIFAFFDTTSMLKSDGVSAKDALQQWFTGIQNSNPKYKGHLYIIPYGVVQADDNRSEQWLQYPHVVKTGQADPDFLELWTDIAELPPGFNTSSYTQPEDVIVLSFVDEAYSSYHDDTDDLVGQPTTRYQTDLATFKQDLPSFNTFKNVLYPIPRLTSTPTTTSTLQMVASYFGRKLTQSEIDDLHCYVDLSLLLTENPYTEGLKDYGFLGVFNKKSPASQVFSSETFASELNDLLFLGRTSQEEIKTRVKIEYPEVHLNDEEYFQNHSFTISYSFPVQRWVSFHSYLPLYYIQTANDFYSGIEGSLWHHKPLIIFNNYYNKTQPYIIEYPYSYKYNDEILQSVQDYTKVYKPTTTNINDFIKVEDTYFDQSIIFNNTQCSGLLNLIQKPVNNMAAYREYPKYNEHSKDILYSLSNSFYNYNTFWNCVVDISKPIFTQGSTLSEPSVLNNANMEYTPRTFKKELIRAKDTKIRHILKSKDTHKFVSQFIVTQTQQSYK